MTPTPRVREILNNYEAETEGTKENLAPADIAVTRLYQAFLRLADTVSKGAAPSALGVDPMKIVGTHCIIPEGKTWKDFVPNHVSLRSMKMSAAKSGRKSQAAQAEA